MFKKDVGEGLRKFATLTFIFGCIYAIGRFLFYIFLPQIAPILIGTTSVPPTVDEILQNTLRPMFSSNWVMEIVQNNPGVIVVAFQSLGMIIGFYIVGLIIAAFGEHVRCQTALADAAEQKQTIVLKEKIIQQPPEMHAVPTRFTEEPSQVKTPANAEPIPEPVVSDAPKDGHPTVNVEDVPKVDFSRRNAEPTAVIEHENQVMKQENETLLKQIKVLEAEKEELIQKLAEKNN